MMLLDNVSADDVNAVSSYLTKSVTALVFTHVYQQLYRQSQFSMVSVISYTNKEMNTLHPCIPEIISYLTKKTNSLVFTQYLNIMALKL